MFLYFSKLTLLVIYFTPVKGQIELTLIFSQANFRNNIFCNPSLTLNPVKLTLILNTNQNSIVYFNLQFTTSYYLQPAIH